MAQNLRDYLNGFSPDVSDIIEKFDFRRQILRLQTANLLPTLFDAFSSIDLHLDEKNDKQQLIQILQRQLDQINTLLGTP